MNGLTKHFHKKPDADKASATTAIEEFRALRGELSEGLTAIRVTLTAMLEELRKAKDRR